MLKNKKGFTLIELMIVIAIIGILAAIAIPNFVSYRDKAYCSAAENDVQSALASIADYFSNPNWQTIAQGTLQGRVTMSYGNTLTLTPNVTNQTFTVTVTDTSNRCPRFDTVSGTM